MACEPYDGSVVEREESPLAEAVSRVGDRWSLLIVDELQAGPRRFKELEEGIAGLASNILSQRLKQLERDGILLARRYSERPPRFEYELTAAGRELAGALRLLAQWGARTSSEDAAPRHVTCGTTLETRWYCPTCGVTVEDPEATELHHV
jgi:DNA-binding HxlR family transcriptional regulator